MLKSRYIPGKTGMVGRYDVVYLRTFSINCLLAVMRPAILKQPQSVHWAALSNAVVFTLEAKGTGVLEYRWWWRAHSGPSSSGSGHCWEALKDCLQCSGAGTPSLTILRVSLQNEGEYKCVVTSRDQCGDLWSDVAVLSVCKYTCNAACTCT